MPCLIRRLVMPLTALLLALGPVLGLTPLPATLVAQAFYPELHIRIFREQLGARFGAVLTAQWVEEGLERSDGLLGQTHWEWHFDSAKSLSEICQRWQNGPGTLLDESARSAVEAFRNVPSDPNWYQRTDWNGRASLGYFGQYLHAIHDFYSHTNWIELAVAQGKQPGLAPIQDGCDSRVLAGVQPGLQSGYFSIVKGSAPDFCGPMMIVPYTIPPKQIPIGPMPPTGFDYCHGPPEPAWYMRLFPASTLPVTLMLSKDLPSLYHGAEPLTLPDGTKTTYHEEAVRLASLATPEAFTVFQNRVQQRLETELPDRDPTCLFQALVTGSDAACPGKGRYQGEITAPGNFGEGVVVKSSRIEITLDPASGLVTGGSLSYEMDVPYTVSSTLMEVTDVKSFTSTEPAEGTVVTFPDGAGGRVVFGGTQTVHLGRFAEREFIFPPTDPAHGIDVRPHDEWFGFVIDKTGQLMLCRAAEQLTMSPDAQTRQRECAEKAFAVLKPVAG